MKNSVIALLILTLAACVLPTEEAPPLDTTDIEEAIEELEEEIEELIRNEIPVVEISPREAVIPSGQTITLSAEVTDDDNEHTYLWTVDGMGAGTDETLEFSLSEIAAHTVTLTVYDGEDSGADSVIVTVTEPPWQPEPLHIYIFEEGAEQSEETIIRVYVADDAASYSKLYSAVGSTVELHNSEGGVQWVRVGGGV